MTKEQNIEIANKITALIEKAKKEPVREAINTLRPTGIFGTALESKAAAIAEATEKVGVLLRQAEKAAA